MATNTEHGEGYRKGAIKGRSQFKHPNGTYIKRDTETGQIIEQKTTGGKFKGVRREHPEEE